MTGPAMLERIRAAAYRWAANPMNVQYLNTDLEIESKSDLSKIVEEFGEDVLVLHHGEIRGYQHASFSIAGGSSDADGTINFFCTLVEQLPKDFRDIWNGFCSRPLHYR